MKYGFGRLFCFVLFAPLLICRAAADESDPQALGSLKAAGVEKIVCVKRHTYNSNHYYTEYINSRWMPGGNLCILSPRDGSVKDLLPAMTNGVFERFDVSFDAKRIVFAWKCGSQDGYRIYEVNADGSGLRQLTFPQPDDAELVKKYRVDPNYHHGTDDMQPCYLADGGIAFISTRCQFGILCDSPDNFTTTVLYRMDADGKNMRRLSSSSVSEASPVMLPDGRIMYTRWEYFDKGAVSVKCLWAMRPDGTSSSDIYGNDIALPPTMIYGRSIPGMANGYVVMGTPHCPQNGVGTVIRLDMTKPIRTREPMTYMTPDVDIRAEPGFAFRAANGQWRNDGEGRGRLFKDPYPLSSREFLVAHKPEGVVWNQHSAYGIYLLNETGEVRPVYRDPEISCWLPYPLKPRKVPPVLASALNRELAAKNQAVCMIADVYHGLEEVPRGAAKYLRILEQIPRPWAAQRKNMDDCYDQQHKCISKDTHLALKVQHGIVPVEADGSAHFFVPAGGNISLQVLDENFMALQTERTYVDYMPGETRSCIGCHETPPTSVFRLHMEPQAARLRARPFRRRPATRRPRRRAPAALSLRHPAHLGSPVHLLPQRHQPAGRPRPQRHAHDLLQRLLRIASREQQSRPPPRQSHRRKPSQDRQRGLSPRRLPRRAHQRPRRPAHERKTQAHQPRRRRPSPQAERIAQGNESRPRRNPSRRQLG